MASSRSPTESNDFSWRSSRSSIRASRKRASRDRSPRMVSPIKASARQPRSQPVHHRNCRRCAAFRAISAQFSPEAVPRAVTADSPAARKWPDIIRPLPNTTGTLSPGSASEQPWPRGRAQGGGRCWAQGRPRRRRTSRRSRNLDRPGCLRRRRQT